MRGGERDLRDGRQLGESHGGEEDKNELLVLQGTN